MPRLSRRDFLLSSAAAGLCAGLPARPARAGEIRTKVIPATGEAIPAIGMGTWITFNVGDDIKARNQRTEVLRNFFAQGGGMIDSSPMYGSSEEVIRYGLDKLGPQPGLFSATKVWAMGWTSSGRSRACSPPPRSGPRSATPRASRSQPQSGSGASSPST